MESGPLRTLALMAMAWAAMIHAHTLLAQVSAVSRTEIETHIESMEDHTERLQVLQSASPQVEAWSTADQGWFYFKLGQSLEAEGQVDEALASHTRANDLLSTLPDPTTLQVDVLLERSYVQYIMTGDTGVYCPDRLTALELAREINDHRTKARALVRAAFCFNEPEQFATGIAMLAEAVELADQRTISPSERGMVYNAAGNLYRRNQLHELAYDYLLKAYEAWAEVDDRSDMFNMQHTLVLQGISLGDFERANQHVGRLFEMAQDSPDFPDFEFFAHWNRSSVLLHQGLFEQAAESLAETLKHSDKTNERYFVTQAQYMYALALFRSGQTQSAFNYVKTLQFDPEHSEFQRTGAVAYAIWLAAQDRPMDAMQALHAAREDETRRRIEFTRDAAIAKGTQLEDRLSEFEATVLAQQLELTERELEINRLQLAAERDGRQVAVLIATTVAISFLALVVIFAIMMRSRRLLRHRARTDPLTEIPNRAYGRTVASQLLAHSERSQAPLSVIVLDIDHFKQINDRHGHAVGDRAIRSVVSIAQSKLADGQLIARLGGEEFLIVLPDTEIESAKSLAEQLRTSIEANPLLVRGDNNTLTVSIGITQSSNGSTLDELIGNADRAMYKAKQAGRNRVESHLPSEN